MIFLFVFSDESLLSHLMKKRLETPALAENECERSSMLSAALSESSESAFRKKDGISIFY